jgi:preprotein translocase subunit SecA
MTPRFDGAHALPFPGIRWGDFPELAEPAGATSDAPLRRTRRPFGARKAARRLERVRAHASAWATVTESAFLDARHDLHLAIARHGLGTEQADRCCAFVVEAARRALGQRAYDGQVLAALHMLDNRLAEMATGEGKSLAVALAAGIAGLAGIPVHVITANDYLVVRDARTFKPLFERLGLGVASVVQRDEPDARRSAYAHAIVYVTAREVAFDYLRDRLSHGGGSSALQQRVDAIAQRASGGDRPQRLLRGLCMAIVDEADAILIDEAQTPLVLSREVDASAGRAFLWQAWALSGRLDAGRDFVPHRRERRITLTDAGRARIGALAARLQLVWKNARHREDTIATALAARHVLQRDLDYIVTAPASGAAPDAADPRGAAIAIVDPTTGRIAEGRRWASGLHALVAIKEGCRPDADLETLARITFQRFFRRYHRLGGMSGTLREARGELARVYGLATVAIAPRRPSQRAQWPMRWYVTDAARRDAVVQRARQLASYGRPVLIGTDSVADSAALAAQLRRAGIPPALLNANFDADEAAIVARAGVAGQVTVATLMAGRGTDIVPDERALQAGGLHVIACQHNASRRLDRQLAGRAGRQGQPGSVEVWRSLESTGFSIDRPMAAVARLARAFVREREVQWPGRLLSTLLSLQQRCREARAARARTALLSVDGALEQRLPFGHDRLTKDHS